MNTTQDQINEQYAIIVASKDYLFNTDFYGHREYEGGAPMPEDVKTKRAQCRAKINAAQEVIKELERQKEHEDPEPPEPIGGEV